MSVNASWSLRYILRSIRETSFIVRYMTGNGEYTNMWLDPWQNYNIIKDDFPQS